MELAFGNGTQPGPDLLGYKLKIENAVPLHVCEIYFRPEKAKGLDPSTPPS